MNSQESGALLTKVSLFDFVPWAKLV